MMKHVGSGFHLTTVDGVAIYVVQPSRPAPTKTAFNDWKDDSNLIAFWWVMSDSTTNEDEANMHIIEKKFGDVKFNFLTNYKAVDKNTRLRLLKEAVDKKPLANVIAAVKVDPIEPDDKPCAKKRQRRS